MEDPLKPQLNYTEALAHIKKRSDVLDAKEKEQTARHEWLLELEKSIKGAEVDSKAELDRLGKEKRILQAEIVKIQVQISEARREAEVERAKTQVKVDELKRQIESLQKSYDLNFARNDDLAKSIRTKEVELAAKRREFDELVRYQAEQEKAVQEAIEAYNRQLQASTANLAELTQQKAQASDELLTLQNEVERVRDQASRERTNLETELTELEEQVELAKINLESTTTELSTAQSQLTVVRDAHEKTVKDTEELIQKSLKERKSADTARNLNRKAANEAFDERRRLQSDRSVFGQL